MKLAPGHPVLEHWHKYHLLNLRHRHERHHRDALRHHDVTEVDVTVVVAGLRQHLRPQQQQPDLPQLHLRRHDQRLQEQGVEQQRWSWGKVGLYISLAIKGGSSSRVV